MMKAIHIDFVVLMEWWGVSALWYSLALWDPSLHTAIQTFLLGRVERLERVNRTVPDSP